jgi:hypothetical protein
VPLTVVAEALLGLSPHIGHVSINRKAPDLSSGAWPDAFDGGGGGI